MTVPARDPEQSVKVGEEDRMVDRQWEVNVPHMSRTMDVVQPTCPTQVVLAAGPHGRVVQPAQVRVEEAVEGVGVGDLPAADSLHLLSRVHQETRSREPRGGAESGIQPSHVHHGYLWIVVCVSLG